VKDNNKKARKIAHFRNDIQKSYLAIPGFPHGDFGEILCYEIHTQPVNPRMRMQTMNAGFETGLTFTELAHKWGISVTFLGEIIADHCAKLE